MTTVSTTSSTNKSILKFSSLNNLDDINLSSETAIDYIEPAEVVKAIKKKLYNFNGASTLADAWNSKQNLIFFGKGGFGKSEAGVLFGDLLLEKGFIETAAFVMAFSQGLTEEKLLGGIDIKEFNDTGKLIYLLKNSFLQHEFVIIEEIWDAHPQVLLVLKDILESGYVRMGNQLFPIKTKMILACTNRSAEEVVSDDSTEALMQRFFYKMEIGWNSFKMADYQKSLEVGVPKEGIDKELRKALIDTIAFTCSKASEQPSNKSEDVYRIPPRMAHKAYISALRTNGVTFLKGVSELSKFAKIAADEYNARVNELKLSAKLNNIITRCKEVSKELSLSSIKSDTKKEDLEYMLHYVYMLRVKLESSKALNNNLSKYSDCLELIKALTQSIWSYYVTLGSVKNYKDNDLFDLLSKEPKANHSTLIKFYETK